MHDLSLQAVTHLLMLAWLGADVLVLREWTKHGTPPRVLETAVIRIVLAAVIALSLVTLAWSSGDHDGGSHDVQAGTP